MWKILQTMGCVLALCGGMLVSGVDTATAKPAHHPSLDLQIETVMKQEVRF